VQSNIQQLVESVQRWFAEFTDNVDISKLTADIQGLIGGLDSLINSPDLRASLAGINQLVNDPDTRSLGKDLRAAIADFRSTLNDTRQLVRNADTKLAPLLQDLGPALDRLDSTLAAGEDVLRNASEQIRGDTELGYQLTGTLSEIKSAARSLRVFLDYLERNPEALLRGKQEPKE
jgi:paraquat-inducible protein B